MGVRAEESEVGGREDSGDGGNGQRSRMGDAREGSRKIDGGVLVGHDNVFQATDWGNGLSG